MKSPGLVFHRLRAGALFLFLALFLAHCATPVGVRHLDPVSVQQALTANILSSDTLSAPTAQILNRAGLSERFKSDPAEVLSLLHRGLPTASEADRLFALAELSYAYASARGPKQYYLASALYAYAFLFPPEKRNEPDISDIRIRVAFDLYNRGIAEAFTVEGGDRVTIQPGTYKLPFGEIVVALDPTELEWGNARFVDFVQAARLDVRGVRNRYRWPGIGAPLAGTIQHSEGSEPSAYYRIPPGIQMAVTALLRPENIGEILKSGHLRGNLELYTTYEATSVVINDRTIPLEYELSSALAYTVEGSRAYDFELKGLFSGDFTIFKDKARYQDGLFFMAPYRPGCIPVVLVHGTASSPVRWAEMLNELQNDHKLWGHYQFWLFTYNTGNPILYSAGILADSIKKTLAELDPDGKDPALSKMVVIGHSQGGLLAKLTAIDSGSVFWDRMVSVPVEQMKVTLETKELIERSMFFKPLPWVNRIVFIATPHRGSYVAGSMVGHLASRLISLPFRLLGPLQEVMAANPQAISLRSIKDVPRSTDNMDPKSRFIKTLSAFPLAEGVKAHSIIAVRNPDAPKEKWTDGVVRYGSAHIDGAVSELVVHSGHSTQSQPETIEEVRRILAEHLKEEGMDTP